MTLDRERILAKLREQRDHIEREYGLRMIGIVGSVARGEARKDSDARFRTSARPPIGSLRMSGRGTPPFPGKI